MTMTLRQYALQGQNVTQLLYAEVFTNFQSILAISHVEVFHWRENNLNRPTNISSKIFFYQICRSQHGNTGPFFKISNQPSQPPIGEGTILQLESTK